jgi:hypothetical protein
LKVLGRSEPSQSTDPGTELPARIAGLLLSARAARGYSAAGGSGGFHDVVPLGGGRWGVAVGDVTTQAQGTDVPLAAQVDVARAVIRTMAQAGFPPSMVLAGTNRALLAARDQPGARAACSLAAAYATVRPRRSAPGPGGGRPRRQLRRNGGPTRLGWGVRPRAASRLAYDDFCGPGGN